MTNRIGSNQPAPRRPGSTGPLPTTAPRPQAPRPAAPADRARLAQGGDATLRRNLGATPQASNDSLLDRALAVIPRSPSFFADRLRSGLGAARTAIRESGLTRPVRLLPRLAQGIRNGITRGFERFGNFVRTQAAQVRQVVNHVRERVTDLARSAAQTVRGEALRLTASAARFVQRELGLTAIQRKVEFDPPSAAERRPDLDAAASRLLADPTRAAAARLAVPAEQREAYDNVFRAMQASPRGQVALQDLAIRGRLAETDLSGGRSMMENLASLASQPVAPGVDRAQLLSEVVQEVAEPVSIAQEARNTCGATTAQIYLANRNGAEYVRLAAGLASPEGTARLQDGTTMQRDPNWNADNDLSGGVPRTSSSRLLQPAFMDVASWGDYQNSSDTNELLNTGLGYPGVMPGRMARLVEGLTGESFTAGVPGPLGAPWREGTRQNPVPMAMNFNTENNEVAPHWIQVTGYHAETGRVEIINPWGTRETIPEDDFRRHTLFSVTRD